MAERNMVEHNMVEHNMEESSLVARWLELPCMGERNLVARTLAERTVV